MNRDERNDGQLNKSTLILVAAAILAILIGYTLHLLVL